ncbi:MAG TPA: alpha/beta fold hydrolase [Acetobacteraceae bacterium]
MNAEPPQQEATDAVSHRRCRLPIRGGNPEGTVEAAWWGPAVTESPSLVLLHEGLGSLSLWHDFPRNLVAATGCGVFAWSRFGYGHSDPAPLPWPPDYMHREAHHVLPAILDAAAIRTAILVGHSDGASIATIHASRGDPRVRGLVLLAPHFFVENVTIARIRQLTGDAASGQLRHRLARHHAYPDMAFNGWSGAWLDPAFQQRFDLGDELRQIHVPVLIVQGRNDPYGTEAQPALAERMIPAAVRTVMLDCGHAPHLEAAAATIGAIAEFCRTNARPL